MNDEQMDALLREHGERWRARQPAAPAVDVSAVRGRARSRWLAPVAAAAAVAAVVGGGVLVTAGHGDRRGEPAPVDPATVPEDFVVPWEYADARHPRWPEGDAVWLPEPRYGYRDGLEACRPEQVAGEAVPQPDGETQALRVIWRLVGEQECWLPSAPTVLLEGPGGPDLQYDAPEDADAWPGDRVVLSPPPPHVSNDMVGAAAMRVEWPPQWCGEPQAATALTMEWEAGLRVTIPAHLRSPACHDPDAADPSPPVVLRRLQPVGAQRVSGDLWMSPLEVRQVSHEAGVLDQPNRFVVELLATGRDLSLEVCPDAQITLQHSYDDLSSLDYGLNCADVPHRDADGSPYLPQGVPVRFEIRTMMSDPPPEAVWWTLQVPRMPRLELEPTDREPAPTTDVPTRAASPAPGATPGTAPDPRWEVPRLAAEGEEANFVLDVSNQSFEQPTVEAQVHLDDVLLVDQAFEVENQHTWVSFRIRVAPGKHVLRVVVGDIAEEFAFTVPGDDRTYGLLQYWTERPRGSFWEWRQQAEPFVYG